MIRQMKITTFIFALAMVAAFRVIACGSASDQGGAFTRESSADAFSSFSAVPSPMAPAPPMAAALAPRPEPVPAPAALSIEPKFTVTSSEGVAGRAGSPGPQSIGGGTAFDFNDNEVATQSNSGSPQAQHVSQRRIIIRTVNMQLVVTDIVASLDQISKLAKEFEGWVVSSDRSLNHRGAIAIRVPSAQLDDVILLLRGMAEEVESEISTSEDVTDEYVDIQSRLTNQQATESALLRLLDRAETVEEALNVQRELSKVQQEIERMEGRIKFLEETSAFSLVSVQLKLAPSEMPVDAGEDQTVSARIPARFRATFTPAAGIDEFNFTWDFGDGSEPVFSNRTAPTIEGDKRVTATITHFYSDVKNSPYIVEIEMDGFGETGVTEGSDILIVTVTDIPTVEVFAGEGFVIDQGEEAEFSGSFTRPEGLTNVNYKWDFGDGTAPETGLIPEGSTRVVTAHVYEDFRPFAYQAVLTITADSEVGEVEVASPLTVVVTEKPAWTVAGWDARDTGRTAVRTLSAVGAGLATAAIWAGIFSPVWIIALGLVYVGRGRLKVRSAKSGRLATEESED